MGHGRPEGERPGRGGPRPQHSRGGCGRPGVPPRTFSDPSRLPQPLPWGIHTLAPDSSPSWPTGGHEIAEKGSPAPHLSPVTLAGIAKHFHPAGGRSQLPPTCSTDEAEQVGCSQQAGRGRCGPQWALRCHLPSLQPPDLALSRARPPRLSPTPPGLWDKFLGCVLAVGSLYPSPLSVRWNHHQPVGSLPRGQHWSP